MKIDSKVAFALFFGIIMITSAAGIALSQNMIDQTGSWDQVTVENVYDRLMTAQEKRAVLMAGRVLIEHLHTGCETCLEKKDLYTQLVTEFDGFVSLEDVEVAEDNQTVDWMIIPTGDIVELGNVTAYDRLVDVFCANTFAQPARCILASM